MVDGRIYATLIACYGLSTVPFTVQYTAWNKQLGGDATSLGWFYAAVGLGALMINSSFSKNGNATFRHRSIQAGLALNIVAFFIAWHTQSITIALTILVMHGMASALVVSSLQTLAQNHVPVYARAFSSSTMHRIYLITGSIASVILGTVLEYFPIRTLFFSSCAVSIFTLTWYTWKMHNRRT